MRRAWPLLALGALAAGGCGQKGPLYLPDRGGKVVTSAPAAPQAQSSPAPESAAPATPESATPAPATPAPATPAAGPSPSAAPAPAPAPKPTDKDQDQDSQPPK